MKQKEICLAFMVTVLVLTASVAWAHKVSVFAVEEGDMVYAQGYYSDGKKVIDSPIEVFDLNGKKLREGRTDTKGEFQFRSPRCSGIKLVLNASMGHRAEFTMNTTGGAKNLEKGSPADKARDNIKAGTKNDTMYLPDESAKKTESVKKRSGRDDKGATTSGATPEEIKRIIDESLDKRLDPLVHAILESRDTGPSITEILGGIGYILGLMGIVMYMKSGHRP
jgi:nickel transport protein